MSENQKLRDVVLPDEQWADVVRLRPLLIGEAALIKVHGDKPVKIVATRSSRPPLLGQTDTFAPGEGGLFRGSAIWVKGKGAHLAISRFNMS